MSREELSFAEADSNLRGFINESQPYKPVELTGFSEEEMALLRSVVVIDIAAAARNYNVSDFFNWTRISSVLAKVGLLFGDNWYDAPREMSQWARANWQAKWSDDLERMREELAKDADLYFSVLADLGREGYFKEWND